jgi:hypothetical protein
MEPPTLTIINKATTTTESIWDNPPKTSWRYPKKYFWCGHQQGNHNNRKHLGSSNNPPKTSWRYPKKYFWCGE